MNEHCITWADADLQNEGTGNTVAQAASHRVNTPTKTWVGGFHFKKPKTLETEVLCSTNRSWKGACTAACSSLPGWTCMSLWAHTRCKDRHAACMHVRQTAACANAWADTPNVPGSALYNKSCTHTIQLACCLGWLQSELLMTTAYQIRKQHCNSLLCNVMQHKQQDLMQGCQHGPYLHFLEVQQL